MKLFSWTHDDKPENNENSEPFPGSPALQERLAELHQMSVREVMTPRAVVMALDVDVQLRRVRRLKSSKAQYFPVYKSDLDHVLGWIPKSKVLELINEPNEDVRLTDYLRPVGVISDKCSVSELGDAFLKTASPFLVVKNGQDATVGIVTLAEFVEVVFGFEVTESPVTQIAESPVPLRRFEL
jgi:CBS domain containing-hemolysin-like protein